MNKIKLLIFILLFSFSTIQADVIDPNPNTRNSFQLMTYNVLNLFDTHHDSGKQDYTWLPASHPYKTEWCNSIKNTNYRRQCLQTDWTPKKLNLKLSQIKKSILFQGPMPELLAVQEIENHEVAQLLARKLGYSDFIITKADDKRGIDVALFYKGNKLKYLNHDEINISNKVGFNTRHILRVHFEIKGSVFGVYVNHWPSQATSADKRADAAKVLKSEIQRQIQKLGNRNYYYVITGDFNTTHEESPNAFSHVLTHPEWSNNLRDVQDILKDRHSLKSFQMAPGTYWYSGKKRFYSYDRILVGKNLLLKKKIQLYTSSFKIGAHPKNSRQTTDNQRASSWYSKKQLVPWGYNFTSSNESTAGYSDHYPVSVTFKY